MKGCAMTDTSYASLEDVKTYLRITGSADDTMLASLVATASRLVEDHCGRHFDTWTGTRRYEIGEAFITGHTLLLDADLLALDELTNADGTPIDPAAVLLRPVNWPPFFGLSLREESGLAWGTDGVIEVTGTWGYDERVPEQVKHATVRLVAWLYRQRDQTGEQPGLPRDVRELLVPFCRLRFRAAHELMPNK